MPLNTSGNYLGNLLAIYLQFKLNSTVFWVILHWSSAGILYGSWLLTQGHILLAHIYAAGLAQKLQLIDSLDLLT